MRGPEPAENAVRVVGHRSKPFSRHRRLTSHWYPLSPGAGSEGQDAQEGEGFIHVRQCRLRSLSAAANAIDWAQETTCTSKPVA